MTLSRQGQRLARTVTHFSFQLIDVVGVLQLSLWLCIRTLLLVLGEERIKKFGLHHVLPFVYIESIGKRLHLNNLSLLSKALGYERIRWRIFSADPFIMCETNEFDITKFFLNMHDFRNFIDVGAHIGKYTLLASRRNSCRVLAVEPDEKNFRILVENLRLNGRRNVQAIRAAVGPRDGFSLLFGGNSVNRRIYYSNKREVNVGEPVKVYTLKTLMETFGFRSVELVKLDVEGLEFSIVYSNEEIMDRIVRWIVEVHDPERMGEIETFFQRKGYNTKRLDESHLFAVRKR